MGFLPPAKHQEVERNAQGSCSKPEGLQPGTAETRTPPLVFPSAGTCQPGTVPSP